jgi:two-component system chemotaxis response regulator CheB
VGKGGYHLTVMRKIRGELIIRCTRTPKHLFMPSVDIMMRSVLNIFGPYTVGVLMTGMGDDGAEAMVEIRRAGGFTIAESEESAIVFGMPREAIERGGAEVVAPSWQIADYIVRAVKKVLSARKAA